ncbi:hypothetical protein SU69_09620 [Thermosipho melanesiensis]|uniref:Adenosyl-chloride synthase n=2 Tax=Thermosipho melanesiensis TaxID=46541 RepID=A6LP82_THEM4|nr:SAM-dependent chlorinase/fluorinase [Thermosipho melanesiensis]ABR31733.1 protein of unknown function DUF62 [Thermosipho melanesiensis BI429]APT74755.1 hypothetical protein BW47_09990 [Thermosipho melanesiensis]OOC35075.1 hypothetical protein SU69_09620 [Thermosipho melanesiensis]OOC35111.1 hypothetical protein SU70_09630 [Thermosipho melanesiensis]OOC36719.1 hypothetical protein SU68_09670 [Thermosipho melanesiensis]
MIVFMSDWGNTHYVGICKGVMRKITTNEIVDLTHQISSFNVREAMYILSRSFRHFPKGTVFLCVVDHGVGSSRKAIAARTENYFFVGPDNGLFTLVFEEEKPLEIRELTNKSYHYGNSETFHGRDIFSPAAAYITKGFFEELGTQLFNYATLPFFKAKKEKDKIFGEVAYIDKFGNIETNIPFDWIKGYEKVKICIKRKLISLPVLSYYSEIDKGQLLIHNDSTGFVEIAANQSNASKILSLKPGDKLELRV